MDYRKQAREINFKDVSERDVERFFGYVDFKDCWLWQGGKSGNYGSFSFRGQAHWPHRFSYFIMKDVEHNSTLAIDHLCRNTLCVNPDHLELVPHGINTLRGVGPSAKNRVKTHCLRGHSFSTGNTGRDTRGDRYCKSCRLAHGRRYYRLAKV